MALRGNGTLITHNNSTYIPPSLMPGYCGYVPTSKYLYGDTFGNATIKYFQDFRSGAMACSTIPYSRGGMFPSIFSNSGLLVSAQRAKSRSPYWARFNVDFKRQETLKSFGELSQKHRESYKDKTGKRLPVKHFVIPVKESEKYFWKQIDQPPMKTTSEGVRQEQALPSGTGPPVRNRPSRQEQALPSGTGPPVRNRPSSQEQALPSGIQTYLDDRFMRDMFFERR
uniref:Ciliary microtubule inner protein 2C n=1 Tax=Oncorhynchus kisutch TaxID=8019 RepID=A0A8C7IWX2_ONCKI